ncbi:MULTISPECIES: DUF4007 family protein [Anaerolinea]|uniref:DUF4007 family protein n=1 Tax=Anaerolinea TaxID=233189 RepID=UPI0026215867|nr:DUF4007 family protein [Anaerolinea thermophila]
MPLYKRHRRHISNLPDHGQDLPIDYNTSPSHQSTKSLSRFSFGGHEKFTFRDGWLKKAIDAILEDPFIFSRDDAFIILGVGKNMATSIRYWGLRLGLFKPADDNPRAMTTSKLGVALLADNGWDPYLEDIGSLWLLHWLLSSDQERGIVWHLIFSRYHDVEFRKSTMLEFLNTQLTQRGINTTEGMIEREFDVFIHTYVPPQVKKGESEETLNCPLVDLNLIRLTPSDSVYRFNVGAKTSLPVAVFGYALLEFLVEKMAHQRTVTLDECVYSPGSPGQIFKLDENSVMAYLEELETITSDAIAIQETAGQRQVYLHAASPELGWDLLRGYYAD